MTLVVSEKNRDILSYEPQVWTSADILRSSVGIKASDFPDFMMPFFALRLVESRLVRKYVEVSEDKSLTTEQDRIDEVKDTTGFYNSVVIEKKTTLQDIVKNDKTFIQDFFEYLKGFDIELQSLLGIISSDKTENLNISSVIDSLKKKNVLFGYVRAWAEIDFTPYDNGEITTLEEHIKRKWADMSAETAGEQYTPYDVFNLIAELITTREVSEDKITSIYDMTCGGANMLFGVEDRLKQINPRIKTSTYGQELRGSLYALAKIEGMFRRDSHIEQGNTLTEDKFIGKTFDVGVANPPYGVSWKEEEKTIKNDQTGRFGHGGYPSVGDGQLLFVQHMISKLNDNGVAYIVLNGSPLFSGDAGGGESNIRKWIMDNDYLEALIQLPGNEFFNTGITTYIWCLNKNKLEDRKNKILCINAEEEYIKLKKNKGDKSKEVSEEQAKNIANIYKNFEVSDISKVLSKFDFYYNKQSLRKLEKDDTFGAFNNGGEGIKLKDITSVKITNRESGVVNELNLVMNLKEESDSFNELIKNIDIEEVHLEVTTNKNEIYSIDKNHCVLLDGKNLGYGDIKVKSSYKKATKTQPEKVVVDISVEPVWTKDDEKIEGFVESESDNQKTIDEFMAKWVSSNKEDYKLLDNTVGVEVNFNSVFPKKIVIRSTSVILAEMAQIEKELEDI